jgi:hypothetical protein
MATAFNRLFALELVMRSAARGPFQPGDEPDKTGERHDPAC